jgi:hypothetical protein
LPLGGLTAILTYFAVRQFVRAREARRLLAKVRVEPEARLR